MHQFGASVVLWLHYVKRTIGGISFTKVYMLKRKDSDS